MMPDPYKFLPTEVRPMSTAPKDGTIIRLFVAFSEHSLEDNDVALTIGHNSFDNTGEDYWQFAGWCWSHDHYTEGKGEVLGWLPFSEEFEGVPLISLSNKAYEQLHIAINSNNEPTQALVDLMKPRDSEYYPTQEEVSAALEDAERMNRNMRLYGTIDKPKQLYTCIGNGGEYQILESTPAGSMKDIHESLQPVVYRDVNTDKIYTRIRADFDVRMELIK